MKDLTHKTLIWSLSTLMMMAACSPTAVNTRGSRPSGDDETVEGYIVAEAESSERLEVKLGNTVLKVDANSVSAGVRIRGSLRRVTNVDDPAVVLAGEAVLEVSVVDVATNRHIADSDIKKQFMIEVDASDRIGKPNDLMIFGPDGSTYFIAEEDLSAARLALSDSAKFNFEIPRHGSSGLKFWFADSAKAPVGFSRRVFDDGDGGTTGLGGGSGSSTETSGADSSTGTTNSGSSSGDSDTTPPAVVGISSNLANGSYASGTLIPIQISFSEPVIVTGSPLLVLETGTIDQTATYASGSSTAVLIFNYTVSSGDSSTDLDYSGSSPLDLNGGTIRDEAGNDVLVGDFPAAGSSISLSANKNIVIDTVAPPALDGFSGVAGSGKVDLTINFPADVSDIARIEIRRRDGAGAPTNCSDGTVRHNLTSFLPDPRTITDQANIGTYSYRACIYDDAGNLTQSNTATSITVSSGPSYSWGAATKWPLSSAALQTSVAIHSSSGEVTAMYSIDPTSSDQDLYRRTFDGSSWANQVKVDSGTYVRSHSIAYPSGGSFQLVYGGQNSCEPLATAESITLDGPDCRIVAGPDGQAAIYSNPFTGDNFSSNAPGLARLIPSQWTEINDVLQVTSAVGYDNSGSLVALATAGNLWGKFWRWNGTAWDQETTTLNRTGVNSVDALDFSTSNSGAMAAFYATTENISDRKVKVTRRDTSGTWQSTETLLTDSGDPLELQGGVDSGGKMAAFYMQSTGDASVRIFNGSSWDSAVNISSSALSIRVCSHPQSNVIFLVWTATSLPNYGFRSRRIVDGVLDGSDTPVLPSTTRAIGNYSLACNPSGQAAIAYYDHDGSNADHEWGVVIFGP